MLYADRFAGHLDHRDPRTPVQGAGGCPWPTIPPYRVQFSSTNATGQFEFLQHSPVILEQVPSVFHHRLLEWQVIEAPPEVYQWTLYKTFTPDLFPGWEYSYVIFLIGWPDEVPYTHFLSGKCNVDVLLGDIGIPYGTGSPGSAFTLFQVEWNALRHPGWLPPP